MKNLLSTILGIAGLFGCLYILLASISLLELLIELI